MQTRDASGTGGVKTTSVLADLWTRSDYGDTWTTPTKVYPSGMTDQFFPWIEADSTGRVHMLCYDTRQVDNDPAQHDWYAEGYYNNYYRYTDNDGQTWNELRLTSPSWILPCNTTKCYPVAFNDYCGMALAGTTVVPIFTTISHIYHDPGPPDPNDPVTTCYYWGDGDIWCRIISH